MSGSNLPNIDANIAIITVNRRLANYLRSQYDAKQQLGGTKAWITPSIIPLSTWLTMLWQQGQHPELLLSVTAEQFLWQQILIDSCEDYPLLDVEAAAQHAQQAATLLQQWEVCPDSLSNHCNPDVAAFYRWWQIYQQRLEQEGWLSQAAIPAVLMRDRPKKLPQGIYLAGFDTLAPNIQTFLQSMAVQELPQPINTAVCQQIAAPDHAHELQWLSEWAHQQWLVDPQINIACLVPDLLTERAAVERAFKTAFGVDYSHAVNMAGGVSLMQYPLIQTAIQWLHLLHHPQSVTSLLLSPYWAGTSSEFLQRAAFDRELRQEGCDKMDLRRLAAAKSCPILSSVVKKLAEITVPDTLYPSAWAKFWQQILQLTGWPGERTLDSEEFQLVQSFQQQLREYAGLDWLLGQHNHHTALAHLQTLLRNALFQVESADHSPIQVLGLLEAAGMQFDKIWICGLSDDRWPQTPAPNPFLPIELQRTLEMPRASSQHELQYAQTILQRISQSCSLLIASYPQTEGDRELSPSPLISDYLPFTFENADCHSLSPAELLTLDDSIAPQITDSEKVRGGTRILQLQAKCPFRAFAEIRLSAEDFEQSSIGYTAAERGSLVHAVLAKLWQQLESSERLHALSALALDKLIQDTVNAIVDEENPTEVTFFAQLNLIDKQRLIFLIHQWLDLEKQRAEFIVKAVEHPVELSLAGLNMRLRVDRIDILGDGSELIIDYKTGSPSPASWFGSRPDEPQLPLYALHNSAVTQGIVFAQLKPHLQKFHGVTATENQLPGVKSVTDWAEILSGWQKHLTQLAVDFCQGEAQVNPKQYPATCNECRLMSLCRIQESFEE